LPDPNAFRRQGFPAAEPASFCTGGVSGSDVGVIAALVVFEAGIQSQAQSLSPKV
jgi:hypothetical protein